VVTVDSAHVAATPSVVRNIDESKTEMVTSRPIFTTGSAQMATTPSEVPTSRALPSKATPSVVRNIDVSKETEMLALRPIIGSVDLAVAPSVIRKIAKKRGYGFWKILFILLALTSVLVLLFLLPTLLRRDLHNSCSSYNSLNRVNSVNYEWIEKIWINGPPPT
jgi:hypothetical protein